MESLPISDNVKARINAGLGRARQDKTPSAGMRMLAAAWYDRLTLLQLVHSLTTLALAPRKKQKLLREWREICRKTTRANELREERETRPTAD